MFSLPPKSRLLRYTCTTLALLCNRYELRKIVLAILTEKLEEIKITHPVSFLTVVNSLGGDAIQEYFFPNMDHFFSNAQGDAEFMFELLVCSPISCVSRPLFTNFQAAYKVVFKERLENDVLYEKYFETFGEITCCYTLAKEEEIEDTDEMTGFDRFLLSAIEQKSSLAMAVNLMKTRRKLHVTPTEKQNLDSVFDYEGAGDSRIKIKFRSFQGARLREKALSIYEDRKRTFGEKQNCVLLGRTTLLASVFKNVQYEFKMSKCYDHSMRSYNL